MFLDVSFKLLILSFKLSLQLGKKKGPMDPNQDGKGAEESCYGPRGYKEGHAIVSVFDVSPYVRDPAFPSLEHLQVKD